MSCEGCVESVTRELTEQPAVCRAEVSLALKPAAVQVGPVQASRVALLAAIDEAGFEAK